MHEHCNSSQHSEGAAEGAAAGGASRRQRRAIGLLFAALLIGLLTGMSPAAYANPVYQIVDADKDPYAGIYLRNSTSMADVTRVAGNYVVYGTSAELVCGAWGEAVGPYANRRWHKVRVTTGSNTGHIGWVADRYMNTPNAANQLTPGEPECGATPAPTPASGPYLKASTPVRMCTTLSDGSCRTVWTLAAGTGVAMRCWLDDSSYGGTVRWFWVNGGGHSGFVSASQVARQSSVGWCGNDQAIKAVRWAGARLDESVYDGYCQRFVHAAWYAAGREIVGGYEAYPYWQANPRGYTRSYDTNPGPGQLVYWKPDAYSAVGHVALSIGSGYVISTYERSTHPIHIFRITDRNATKPYAGYLRVS